MKYKKGDIIETKYGYIAEIIHYDKKNTNAIIKPINTPPDLRMITYIPVSDIVKKIR